MLLLCSQIIDFITSVSQVRAGDDGGSGERQRIYGRCLLQPGVEPTGHKDRPFPSHRRCLNSPITWLPVGLPRNVRGALGAVSAMSQPCSPVSLCWKGKVSCLPAMGAAGLERSLMQERRGLCHPPLTRLPSPGQSPVYQASAPTSPMPRPWGWHCLWRCRPWPWDVAGHVCPTQGFCCGCNQPCDSPTAARTPRSPSPSTHSTAAPRSQPSLLEHLQQQRRERRAHSYEEGVLQLCQVQLTRPGLRAPPG